MNKDIALKLALKELVFYRDWAQCQDWRDESQTAITAIKEALPQPNQIGFMDSKLNPIERIWVGLTNKEIEAIWEVAMFANYGVGAELSNQPFVHYARAIEAKLRSKNS